MTSSGPSPWKSNSEIRRCMLRAQLIDELTREGVHVALPAKLCGFDLLAYTPRLHTNSLIAAAPIQLAAMSYDTFLRDFAALRANGLLAVLLEDHREPRHVRTFALAAPELMLLQMVGLIDASGDSRRESHSKVSALRQALEPYEMVPGSWHSKISRWILERQSRDATFRPNQSALS
jgi:hypothetical protein